MPAQNQSTLKKPTKVDQIDIKRHGEAMIIPESITLADAKRAIEMKMEYEEEVVSLSIPIDGFFLWDAALAFHKAIAAKFGWSSMVPTPGFFGPELPTMIGVEIDVDEVIQIPWGSIKLPGVEGRLQTGHTKKEGRFIFEISGKIKRKHENTVDELVTATRELLKKESIYRGKPIRMRFRDDQGEELLLPEPKFLDLSNIREHELIYAEDTMRAVRANLFTPVERTAMCRKHQMPLKRGVLLAGPYGTGKTLAAMCTAVKAVRNGWTYIACDRADELADVLRFAHLYGPAVVFCEDIDRVMSGERTIKSDEMLNLIDGIESKGTELIVVFTSNEVEKIQPALLRPGRLDAVIHIGPPDAEAALKLLKQYSRNLIRDDEDLTEVGILLQGKMPAVIREIAEKSKAYQIALTETDEDEILITSAALKDTIFAMDMHLGLLNPKEPDNRSPQEKAGAEIRSGLEYLADRAFNGALPERSDPTANMTLVAAGAIAGAPGAIAPKSEPTKIGRKR